MNLNGEKIGFLESLENKIETILALFLSEKIAKTSVQLCKCGIVGVSNTLINLAVFNLLIYITKINTGSIIKFFTGIAFCFAVTNSFIWNKKWTFRNKAVDTAALKKQIVAFLFISLGGLALSMYTAELVVVKIGSQFGISNTIWSNIGNISAMIITILWNFTGYKLIVFKK